MILNFIIAITLLLVTARADNYCATIKAAEANGASGHCEYI